MSSIWNRKGKYIQANKQSGKPNSQKEKLPKDRQIGGRSRKIPEADPTAYYAPPNGVVEAKSTTTAFALSKPRQLAIAST